MKLLLTTIFLSWTLFTCSCNLTRKKQRNAEGQMKFNFEPAKDMIATERVKRQASFFTTSTMNRDVLFLIDESGSVGSTNFNLFKDFAATMTEKFCSDIDVGSQKTRVAAMTFSTYPTIYFDFDDSFIKSSVVSSIRNIPYKDGETFLAKALKYANDNLFTTLGTGSRFNEKGTERLIILLSDGCENCNTEKLINMRKEFEKRGISFVAFLVGESDEAIKDMLSEGKCYEAFRFSNWNDFKLTTDYMKKSDCRKTWDIGQSCPT